MVTKLKGETPVTAHSGPGSEARPAEARVFQASLQPSVLRVRPAGLAPGQWGPHPPQAGGPGDRAHWLLGVTGRQR